MPVFVIPAVIAVVSLVLAFVTIKTILSLRRVVPTNEVHIVQSSKRTISYGKDTGHGNTYYLWPAWMPFIGITRSVFPTSVFDIDLLQYEAYEKGRLPFVVNVKGFFRIDDSNTAAQRVADFKELKNQLEAIMQGAVRVTLASHDLEEIMNMRDQLGNHFTKEVQDQLKNWGVTTVKNIELMDLHDHKDSKVIHNMMEKKKSQIEAESRTEVAKNKKAAQIAEIEAQREIDLQSQEALQTVGLRTVEAERQVELRRQEMVQALKEQEKVTKDKEMDVMKIAQLRAAEIEREVQIVQAERDRSTAVLKAEASKNTAVLEAEGRKMTSVLVAEGNLETMKREAEGIQAQGLARAESEKALQMAPVTAQITLAKEIGENQNYQDYLLKLRQVEANQVIGVEQAKALESANIKVIATAGKPAEGVSSVMDLFSAQGGTSIAAAVEGFIQTDAGKLLVEKALGKRLPEDTK